MESYSKPRWLIQVHSDLMRHEGYRRYAYPDPLSPMGRKRYKEAGYIPGRQLMIKYGWKEEDGAPWTYGHGFTHGVTPDSQISLEMSKQKLLTEIVAHLPVLDKLVPGWNKMPLFAVSVLVNLAFNMGYNTLKEFKGTLDHAKKYEWGDVAEHLENSLWYRQVGVRGKELVWRMRHQMIQPEYIVADFSGVSSTVSTTAVKQD